MLNHPTPIIVQKLRELALFSALSEDELMAIAQGVRQFSVNKGDTLFHKGSSSQGFYIVLDGQMKLVIGSADGREKVVNVAGPGHTFGEAIMFLDKPHIVSAVAISDARLLNISKEQLFAQTEKDPILCRKLLAGMAMRLHRLLGDLEYCSLYSGKMRVVRYLLQQLSDQECCLKIDQATTIHLALNKSVIASSLNLTPEHFSRVLQGLTQKGLIEVEGANITIPDISALQECLD